MATALAMGVILAVPAAAPAQAPSISVHAIFSGGKTSGFTVGTVLQVQYRRDNARGSRIAVTRRRDTPVTLRVPAQS